MTVSHILCDCCKEEIISRGWEDAPGTVDLIFGCPEQEYVSRKLQHVCYPCRQSLKTAIVKTLKALAPQ